MRALVVILNYRTPELAIQCLASLEHEIEQVGSIHVAVTDNASGDGSVDKIAAAIASNGWDWCTLLPLQKNGGYCFGNNAGIRPFLNGDDPPELVMLVNPDAYIRENAITKLLEFMDAHPEVGIAGARVEAPDGTPQHCAFRFPSIQSELLGGFRLGVLTKALRNRDLLYDLGNEPLEVDWVTGAAMMIRREVFDAIGLLDEGYFLYFDEVDFCLRARRAGWLVYYVPDAVVAHLQAQATGITDGRKKQRRYPDYWFDSRRRFFVKNHGKIKAMAADVAFLTGYATYRARRVIQRKPDLDPPRFWYDFLRNSTLVKGFDIDRKASRVGS
jgi:GT2 family glycosyltransferase